MPNDSIIRTDRLILRNLTDADIEVIADYRSNEQCYKYQRWEDTSPQSVARLVNDHKNCVFLSQQREQHYAICLHDNTLVGDLTYFYNDKDVCITLGYTISYRHQRHGYAFEMLSKVVEETKIRYPGIDIVGLVEKENLPSIRLLEKLGFKQQCYADKIQSYVYIIR